MNLSNLSFDSLPPIDVPFRYFITAPLFVIAIAFVMLFTDNIWWVSRWQPNMLALTHTFTLGFIASIMLGALFQLLPVAGGLSFPKARFVATLNHFFHSLGSICLIVSFFSLNSLTQLLAMIFLGFSFSLYIMVIGYALYQHKLSNDIVMGIKLAIIALAITVSLGVLLQSKVAGFTWINWDRSLTNLHALWGLTGWIAVLIITISFQVIPMFHVAPEFPKQIKKYLGKVLLLLLILFFFFKRTPQFSEIFMGGLLLINGLFGFYLLKILAKRKRKVADTTINYWQLAAISLFLINIIYFIPEHLLPQFIANKKTMLLASLFIFGYVVSILEGMLLKILPFLTFTHLQQQCAFNLTAMQNLPNMHEILPKKYGQLLFYLHIMAGIILITVLFQPQLTWLLGLAWLVEFGWLWLLMIKVAYLYYHCANKIKRIVAT